MAAKNPARGKKNANTAENGTVAIKSGNEKPTVAFTNALLPSNRSRKKKDHAFASRIRSKNHRSKSL